MSNVEGKHIGYSVHIADGHKAGVMDPLADYPQRPHQGLPCRIDVGCFRQQWESRFEDAGLSLRIRSRKAQTVHGHWAGRDITELDQDLRREV